MILRIDPLPVFLEYHARYIVLQICTEIEIIGAFRV